MKSGFEADFCNKCSLLHFAAGCVEATRLEVVSDVV